MKILSFLLAVCCCSSLLAAQQQTTSFHATAEGASVNATIDATNVFVSVARGFFANQPGTFMGISSFTQNPDGSFTFLFGNGTIPDQDYTNAGMEQMDLNVDTSQVSTFHLTQCTFTFTPFFSSTCGAGPTGAVQIHWTNNKIMTKRFLVDSRRTFPVAITVREHSDQDISSADASGSVLGLSFSNEPRGQVILNRDTTITITQ
jgi:hypothetical protein